MARSDRGSLEALTSLALSELGVNMSSRILCATSGGADSVTMAYVLNELVKKGQFRDLAMIHINHGLRGKEADDDETYVREFATKQGMRLYVVRTATAERSHIRNIGIEEAARDDRYEQFAEIARKEKFDIVVTAHTINDTLETVLHNMIRGTGIRGLRGIPPRRALSDVIEVIRPWLDIERNDILKYAGEHGVEYREDSTNLLPEFLRNRLRHRVVPALEEAFQFDDRNIYDGFRRTMKNIGEAVDEINMTARTLADLCSVDLPESYLKRDAYMCSEYVLSSKGSTMRRAFIIEVLQTRLREPYSLLMDSVQTMLFTSFLDDQKRTELLLTSDILITKVLAEDETNIYAGIDFDDDDDFDWKNYNLIFERLDPYPDDWQKELAIGDGIETYAGILTAELTPKKSVRYVEGDAYFDHAELFGERLIVRVWQEGDRIAPFGMRGHTKLVSDILNEAGISHHHKRMCVVVTLAGDPEKILWVPGLRAVEFARVTDRTETVLVLRRKPL